MSLSIPAVTARVAAITSSLLLSIPGAQAVELLRDDLSVDFLTEAVRDLTRSRDEKRESSAPVTSDPTRRLPEQESVDEVDPPQGARSYEGGREAEGVESEARPVRWDATKPPPNIEASSVLEPRDWAQLSFSSSSFTPEPGLGERLREALEAAETKDEAARSTYGFLLMEEALSEKTEQELESLGLTVLGLHDTALKVKFPLRRQLLEAVIDLPYVEWIGFSLPEQKLSERLSAAIEELGDEINAFPIVVNLFEGDREGVFAREIEAVGIELGDYDPELAAYTAAATREEIEALTRLDFVLFIELERPMRTGHDESMATMGADYIRAGGGGTNFSGASTVLGILDTGFMVGGAAPTTHFDLNKFGCGRNFTSDSAGVWNDENSHGTHVLGTIVGTGAGDQRFRGAAPGVGGSGSTRIRAAKVWNSANTGTGAWTRDAMDYMDDGSDCDSPRPLIVNISGGASGANQTGTDSTSRKLDSKVFGEKQAYIVCSGNSGSGSGTIWSPGVAKNAFTVGNVLDNQFPTVGDIRTSSSRGPTGDGRMKPNVVGAGTTVTSARAGTTDQYSDKIGCSMATPHVSGIAATLLQHYADFRERPYLLRAHLMATSILHDDGTTPANNSAGGRNTYGLGRVATYPAHWARPNANGWTTHWAWRTITDDTWGFRDINVPSGTDRLVVVMTWDEPAASAGASAAVTYDLDLWADRGADCTPDDKGQCGEYASQSYDDNTEYLIIENPGPGTYRLKIINWHAPGSGLPAAIAATVIRGDPTPTMSLTATPSTATPGVGSTFTVTTSVRNTAYVASGVHLSVPAFPLEMTLLGVTTTREDGVTMDFDNRRGLTLGNIVEGDSRSAVWRMRADTPGRKTLRFRAWSENGGTQFRSVTVDP